jgi:hypothetical protein
VIEYRFQREKELLLEYAARLGDEGAGGIVARGRIATAEEARALAKFYWRMVDASMNDEIDSWLERINTTLFIAFENAGFEEIWDEEIPLAG